MSLLSNIIFYSFASGVASLIGGVFLLGNNYLVRKFAIHFVSFSAGTLLATAFIDLLPEAFSINNNSVSPATLLVAAMIGMLVFFILEHLLLRFQNNCYNENHENHKHSTPVLLNIGDGLHNFIDGVVLAGAFISSPGLGILTAIAIAAHEIPQEISDFSLMLNAGWSNKKVLMSNVLVSLTNVAGAVATYVIRDSIEPYLPYLLATTAGIFIYIAAANLFPQLNGDKPDKPLHIVALLLLGVVFVWILSRWIA